MTNTTLQKIHIHLHEHDVGNLAPCPMIINRMELCEHLDDAFLTIMLTKEQVNKMKAMKNGFIGWYMGVPLYLID